MAQIESGGKSGRRVSVELNLVPFIDLMSVLITFLLITAVWTQVSMMQIGSSVYGKKTEDKPEINPDSDIVLKLDIANWGYRLTIGQQVVQIPNKNNDYDELALEIQLKKAKELYPKKLDAAVAMSDELPYERLIKGMDAFLKTGFPSISVLTGGPN